MSNRFNMITDMVLCIFSIIVSVILLSTNSPSQGIIMLCVATVWLALSGLEALKLSRSKAAERANEFSHYKEEDAESTDTDKR